MTTKLQTKRGEETDERSLESRLRTVLDQIQHAGKTLSKAEIIQRFEELNEAEEELTSFEVRAAIGTRSVRSEKSGDSVPNLTESGELCQNEDSGKGGPRKIPKNRGQSVEESVSPKVAALAEQWRSLSHAERRLLEKQIKRIEAEDYHRLIFGDLTVKPTVNRLNAWFNKMSRPNAPRFDSKDYPFVARAIQHFRNELGVELKIKHPKTGKLVSCRVDGDVRPGRNAGRFTFKEPNKKQTRIAQLSQLPQITAGLK